jgi:hypothetical protein
VKVLAPAITCLIVSHMKPTLRDTLVSVLAQTRRDFEAVVVDSGQWIGGNDERAETMAAIHADYAGHPLIRWVTSGEPANLRGTHCPIAWATNRAIESGLVRGRLVCTFYDDDRYMPGFMQKMAGFLDAHPESLAVCCSQQRTVLRDGVSHVYGHVLSGAVRRPGDFDCKVDGAQVMFRREILDRMGSPWLDENPGECHHSDGVFMERLAVIAGEVPGIADILCEHRHTPYSTYTPS